MTRQQKRYSNRNSAKQVRSNLKKEVRVDNAKRGKGDSITIISNDWRTYYV